METREYVYDDITEMSGERKLHQMLNKLLQNMVNSPHQEDLNQFMTNRIIKNQMLETLEDIHLH
jgi:hypothetical protein